MSTSVDLTRDCMDIPGIVAPRSRGVIHPFLPLDDYDLGPQMLTMSEETES